MREPTLVRQRIRSAEDVAEIETSYDVDELLPAETILGCLRHVAAQHPEKPAIFQVEEPDFLVPKRTVTYADLVADVQATANLFRSIAGGADSVVGLMLPMVPEGLSALWGAQTAGVGIPLNPFLDLAPVAAILVRTRATILLTTREVLEAKGGVAALRAAAPGVTEVLYVDDLDPRVDLASRAAAHSGPLAFVADEDPQRDALLMPTGGTTGAPKLVRMSQAGQLRVSWNVAALMGNEPDGVTAHGMPNFHCGGTISLGLRTLVFGGTLLTLTEVGFRSRAAVGSFWDIARHYRVTSLLATPTTALALLHGDGNSHGCVLRDFHVGGSAVPMEMVRAFHDRFGIWLRENWGMTELHGTTTGHFNNDTQPRVGSVGRPLPFVRVKAVELDETGRWVRDCEVGERGLLLTATPTAMAGYADSELDRDFFPSGIPGDLPAEWRWGNTGDLGSVDRDGYVWVFGRAKDLIIRGGHNIDPREIEDALASHPDVHLAAAIGRPDPAKGELPVAYVEARVGATLDAAELLEHCRTHVHERAAVPVEVIVLDQIPLTPVGKVSKPALRADAVTRVVAGLAHAIDPAAEIVIDQSGARLGVVVVVHDPASEEPVRRAVAGFEFATRVHVSETPR
ncbi:O-succinylbenzoate--CoA ligase [Nocardioides sp. Root190]|uniref:AMP-binding protein n=1 Tax=Nocardioides sp. Root190 TaxID=1736488 RepID=UPI0006F818B9|nr:AMP-binding protein [Nocardioides sp. Root190]KRB76127.1 O-succinylbenzoate--CoA ligase [Nocardioides sp. Root190]